MDPALLLLLLFWFAKNLPNRPHVIMGSTGIIVLPVGGSETCKTIFGSLTSSELRMK